VLISTENFYANSHFGIFVHFRVVCAITILLKPTNTLIYSAYRMYPMKIRNITTTASIAALLALTGCSSNQGTVGASADTDTAARLAALKEKEAQLAAREQELQSRQAAMTSGDSSAPATMYSPSGALLPPNAKAGECYARLLVPPRFASKTEKVLAKPEGERLEIIPAKYETVTERVMVSEASEKLVPVPATYETVSERIQISDGELIWKYGHNGIKSARSSKALMADSGLINAARSLGLPENAQAGQCFAEYYMPASYETVSEKMLKSEASQRVETIPAKYEMVTEKVLVSEAYETLTPVPATYETITEKVMVAPGYTDWKISECSGGACFAPGVQKVSGVADRIDQATGEVMCLVEVPPKYKTITKRVMKTPPTTKKTTVPAKYNTVKVRKLVAPASEKLVQIPATYQNVSRTVKKSDPMTNWCPSGSARASAGGACASGKPTGNALCLTQTAPQYRTVSRQVVKTPASSKKVMTPEQYKTVKVRKLVTPASERRITIPAKYETVTRSEKISEGEVKWMPVLCQVNMTRAKIREIQSALAKAGYYKGPIDGIVGTQTTRALQKFQTAKGLTATTYLTVESIKALGVNPS
jgi:outer membrane murein-binding lipoprotein Lpp